MDGSEPNMVSQLLEQRVTHEFDSQRFGAMGNLDLKDSDLLNRIFTGFPTSYSNELPKRQRLVDSLEDKHQNSNKKGVSLTAKAVHGSGSLRVTHASHPWENP